MKRFTDAFWKFWATPADPTALAAFRLGSVAVALLQVVVLWPSLLDLYGNFGFVQWVVSDANNEAYLPSIGTLALRLDPFDITSAQTVYAVFSLYTVSLTMVLVGLRTRLFALVALVMHSMTVNSGYLSLYGVDTMIQVALFYLTVLPTSGRWSVDVWRRAVSGAPSVDARLGLRVLQLHVCLIYLNAGFSKAMGEQWWSGEALWRALMLPHFAVFDLSWLAAFPIVLMLGSWGTLLLECGYALAVWVPRVRRPWVLATVGLHLGIAALMGLWLFSLQMVVFNLSVFWLAAEARGREEPTRVSPAGALAQLQSQ